MEGIMALGGILILMLLVERGKIKVMGILIVIGILIMMGGLELQKDEGGVLMGDSMGMALMGMVGVMMIWVLIIGTAKESWWIIVGGVGGVLIIGAGSMLLLYMAIELQAISIYVMLGQSGQLKGIEGAIKYYIIGGISTGLIIYGSSIVYKMTGEMSIRGLSGITMGGVGKGLVTMGLLIKMSAAPMHMWAPDVYEGATMGGIAMLGTIGKLSIMGALIHIGGVGYVMMMSSVLSIVYGALGAMNQSKMKRLIGYSGIGHMGYILMGISIGTYEGLEGGLIYIVIYMGMMVGMITIMKGGGLMEVRDYIGQSRSNKIVGVTMGILLITMAGVPPLWGFIGKWLIIGSTIMAGYWIVGIIGGLMAIISVVYYIRIVQVEYFIGVGWEWVIWQRTIRGDEKWTKNEGMIIGGMIYMGVMGIWQPKIVMMVGQNMMGIY